MVASLEFIRLRVSGFKSFCDATELEIGPGLTGIVGPNGCGKSNVVEALRWVMGESSAKGLRGGEMDDVIFGGSAVRAPYDLAEVALGLKRPPVTGDDAAIAVLPKSEDLEISRRIGRGTGSLYRLNGREVRQRDIQLLFADVGAGAKSPAIVGQGQVGFIVEAKPEERRRLLEEAAGIGGMHSRRREAELKLQATLANLERVTDQLGILAQRRTALEKQARDAERYKKLQAQIRALDAYLVRARITAGRAALEAAAEALGAARLAQGERRALAEAAEAAHEAATAELPALRDAAAVATALFARLAERHERQAEATAQEEAAVVRLVQDRDETASRLAALDQALEAGTARRTAIAAAESELEQRLAALADESEALGPELAEAETTRRRLADEAQGAAAEAAACERRLEAERTRHDERHRRLRAVQTELARLGEVADDALVEAAERKHREVERAVAAATAELAAARATAAAAAAPLDAHRRAAEAARAAVQAATAELTGLEAEHERRQTAIRGHLERRQWHERALEQLRQETERLAAEAAEQAAVPEPPAEAEADLAALEARAAALDGEISAASATVEMLRGPLDEATRTVGEMTNERLRLEAEAAALASLAEPMETTPVLDGLTVEPGFETALTAALGDDLMAGTDPDGPAYWQYQALRGAAPALPEGAARLADHVTGASALASRLAQIGVVTDAATAQRLQPGLAQGQRLVTRDGGLWRWDGFVRDVASDDPIAKKLARRQRRQAIGSRLTELEATAAQCQQALAAAETALEAALALTAALGAERADLLPRIERDRRDLATAREAAERRRAAAARLATAEARVAAERAEHESALEAIETALAREGTAALDAEIDAARLALQAAESRAGEAAATLQTLEAASAAAAAALAEAEAAERRLVQEELAARLLFERRAAEASLRKSHREQATGGLIGEEVQLKTELTALDQAITEGQAAHTVAETARQALEEALATAVADAEALRGRAVAAEAERRTAATRLRDLGEEARHLAADLAQRASEREATASRLAALTTEVAQRSTALDQARQTPLHRELEQAEAASRGASSALAAAEAELERLADERRRAEAGLAEAKEAVALAEADRERQSTAQAELEHETTRRLGQPIELVLAAVNDPEITRALEHEPPAALEARLDKLKTSRERLGAVNLRASIECEELAAEIAGLEREAAELEEAVERLQRAIATLNREARTRLEAVFDDVDRHFRHLFQRLFGGGKAHLRLVNMDDPLHAGLELEAMPPGKKLQNIRLLSGGEKSLTALALVFAFFLTQPSPLCVLDEVDAALDDANVERFADLLEEMAKETQTRFLVVTHHPLTMARMHRLFGVTMAERGVSKLVSVAFDEAERFKESA